MIATKVLPRQRLADSAEGSQRFDWPLANDAEAFLRDLIEAFLVKNSFARESAKRMRDETATDFFEWVDHIIIPAAHEDSLRQAGFVCDSHAETTGGEAVYEHPRATLPSVLLRPNGQAGTATIALRPESVAEVLGRHSLTHEPESQPYLPHPPIGLGPDGGAPVVAIERRP